MLAEGLARCSICRGAEPCLQTAFLDLICDAAGSVEAVEAGRDELVRRQLVYSCRPGTPCGSLNSEVDPAVCGRSCTASNCCARQAAAHRLRHP